MKTKNLKNSYNGLTKEEILSLSHQQLQEAVLRMFDIEFKNCEDYYGDCLLVDDLADAFRNR
jgi:hypothetical protein